MLAITNLSSGYNGMEILHGIDMQIKAGEIVALIGPNGAGKSTLLKSIFNLCSVYAGNIHFKDKDITRLPTYELIQEGISFVPQGRLVFSALTVRENLEMGAFVFKDKEIVKRNLEAVMKQFPMLKEKENQYAYSLSGGQQQMLSIARALIQNPQLLLMDEPSLGLSPKAAKDVFAKITQINKEGVSIIIVEQNARQAVQIAHRTYILENGKIALEGGKEILANPKVKKIYFGGT